MKSKTIKAILSKKFNEWVATIEDEKVKILVKENSIITGGSIVSLLTNEKPNDYDVYFTNKETVKAVSEYYVKKWNDAHKDQKNKLGIHVDLYVLDGSDVEAWKLGKKNLSGFAPNYSDIPYGSKLEVSHMITNTPEDRIKIIFPSDGIVEEKQEQAIDEYIEACNDLSEMDADNLEKIHETESQAKYRPLFITTNAITLSDKIQIVIRFYGKAEEIHKNYDFEHCKCYWTSTGTLELPARSLEAILNKELIYSGSKYPLCSVIRTRKFIKRGWHINAGQYLKMCFQISELNLHDIDVLEDQLVGVDSVYFSSVVDSLRKLNESGKGFDTTYLNSIIDKIF